MPLNPTSKEEREGCDHGICISSRYHLTSRGCKERVTTASMLPFLEVESLPETCRSMVIATPPGFQSGEGSEVAMASSLLFWKRGVRFTPSIVKSVENEPTSPSLH